VNLSRPQIAALSSVFRLWLNLRRLWPRRKCRSFGPANATGCRWIEKAYVINLDRQPERWSEMQQELRHILDASGTELLTLTERHVAVDANTFKKDRPKDADIDPFYTLGEQLFVEPQPLALPTRLELNSPIRMSQPEIAVASSHIGIWRKVAVGRCEHSLILEDDVWFRSNFTSLLDRAWREIGDENDFDILYLSYDEVKGGAPKTYLSENVFRPERGLWHLSGYVLSREGAKKLLRLLPCRGPVDLWINHQFGVLDVRATRLSMISQKSDGSSTNSYSILPSLTKIGAITSEGAALFQLRPVEKPVFAFGPPSSGLSSLAMGLSMLGYRCCSDLQEIPSCEHERLFQRAHGRIFNAYVNVGSLTKQIPVLREVYPNAKFIITSDSHDKNDSVLGLRAALDGADFAVLPIGAANKWQIVCEHLRCSPPPCSFPLLADLEQRKLLCQSTEVESAPHHLPLKRDDSPWVVEPRKLWEGIYSVSAGAEILMHASRVRVEDNFECLNTTLWTPRSDTFTDNLALFRPANITFRPGQGAELNVKKQSLGVREYSAAALTSCDRYLYGRFEAVVRASNTPGIVTGFFLHRDSPRQEIDIEIAGKRADRLLINVFYNPGGEGAKFDYGYRGAPSCIDLGFDASQSDHLYAIEWDPFEIRWFVDNRLVHRRVEWDPTPIPNLPMTLHINAWPSRSEELAGKLAMRRLPSTTFIRSIALSANQPLGLPSL
jgi:GR25 family glycosyltransferase involved in LPS biosynthesis